MQVVLDANIIVSEGFGNSALFRFFLSSSELTGYRAFVPKPVIEEVVGQYRQRLDSGIKKVETETKKLSDLLNRPLLLPTADLQQEVTRFTNELELMLIESNCTLLDYPDIPHEDIVWRAIARRRPFDNKGSGYRDTLVWQSVLDLADRADSRVALLAADKDFQDEEGTLHPDLGEDLENRGQSKDKVLLVNSLLDFVDTYIRPNLKRVFEDNPTRALSQMGIELSDAIGVGVYETYSGVQFSSEDLGVRWEFETLGLDMVSGVSSIEVMDAREVETGKFLLQSHAELVCEFDVFVYKSDAFTIDELSVWDTDWNDHYVRGSITLELGCQLDLVVDVSDPGKGNVQVLSAELETMGP